MTVKNKEHKEGMVYSFSENDYIEEDSAVLCECDNDYYPDDSEDICYCGLEEVYRLIENCFYSEYHDTYIHEHDCVHVDEQCYHVNDIGDVIVELDDGDFCLKDNAQYSEYHDCWFRDGDDDYIYVNSLEDYIHYNECTYCEGCGEYYQNDDTRYCDDCGTSYCNDCSCDCEDDEISDINDFTGQILSYDCKPDYPLFNEVYEKNNQLYLGIELEIELHEASQEEVYRICEKYMRGKYVFKHDGSLNHGFEIVFAPHTIQALKKINFYMMLKDLRAIGCRSYQDGTCGLHIHVSKRALKNDRVSENICRFLMNNRSECIAFSQRSEENCERWANIHDDISDFRHTRCSALNLTNWNTIEFRLFRGTLDYKRFKSTIQFVDALVNAHNMRRMNKTYTWESFKEYLSTNKEYTMLEQYLESKCL